MTEKDYELIKKAWSIRFIDWSLIDNFIYEAATNEAKERLRVIRNYKYHLENAH